MGSPTKVSAFWDDVYTATRYAREPEMHIVQPALARFGDVRGKTLVELGCGPGAASLFFAAQGANVIAVDVSAKAINDLNDHCVRNGITNVRALCTDAFGVEELPPVDFVYGSMILHHIEPFPRFAVALRRLMKPDAVAFFYENSAMSRVLVWFRQHIVGKLWVPKYGDDEEFPLTPGEIDELRRYFNVEVEYPEMLFFRLASQYLLRGRMSGFFGAIDDAFYKRRWMVKYSYRQFLTLR